MKTVKSVSPTKASGWRMAALLAVILAVLFWRSFLPGYVHFSNDGPLSQQVTAWSRLPQAFSAEWADMNGIGNNGGSYPLDLSSVIHLLLGPEGYAKFLAPLALFILGLGAWAFFRQLKLSPLAATLGALAMALNSSFFSNACWGVAPHQVAMGLDFFALALILSNTGDTPMAIRWIRLAVAGFAVGVNVMEASDIGDLLSVLVAAFVFFKSVADESGPVWVRAGRGAARVAVVAVFAGFIAFQSVVSLISTQIQGVVGMGQDAESKARNWNFATEWSLPKTETLGLIVPGIFGYRYDTPANMMDFLQDSYQGGAYWGWVGSDQSWDSYFAHGETGPEGHGIIRWSGGQNYAGILVALVALWTISQAFRRQNSVFPNNQRRLLWFWTAVLIASLLLAWGRFAHFYQFFYMLPYASVVRNPAKFLIPFTIALVTLFAYGVDALSRRYLEVPATGPGTLSGKLKDWWRKAGVFERNWTWFCLLAFITSAVAWLVYATREPALVSYLQKDGDSFRDEQVAKQIADFSIGQGGWFIVLLALAIILCLLVLAGVFAGKRARLGGILLGAFLVADLGRANLPFITHWNYSQKVEVDPANPQNSSNPIIKILRDKAYEHRVARLNAPAQFQALQQLYYTEWLQHHFPYYNIQSLDVVQQPRLPADQEAYELAFVSHGASDSAYLVARHWQMTNTRYLLGPAGYLESLNDELDPVRHSFRFVQRFSILPRPDVAVPNGISPDQFVNYLTPDKYTAVADANGPYALFEFGGALPRAKLYTDWQTNSPAELAHFTTNGLDEVDLRILSDAGTNGFITLKKLASRTFDPERTVLLNAPLPAAAPGAATNQNPGTVDYQSYSTRDLKLATQSAAPAVLLLNDKYDPHWSVTVDGQPAEVLCCNFIMRGVFVPPGAHAVEFKFSLPHKPLYITLTALVMAVLLCGGLLAYTCRRPPGDRK
jgi:hypothetical protein